MSISSNSFRQNECHIMPTDFIAHFLHDFRAISVHTRPIINIIDYNHINAILIYIYIKCKYDNDSNSPIFSRFGRAIIHLALLHQVHLFILRLQLQLSLDDRDG